MRTILSPLTSTLKYSVKNSFELVTFIKTVELNDDYVLISLDVVSLFTNIQKDLVKSIINKIWSDIQPNMKINEYLLLNLIDFCFESGYFSFEGQWFKQIEGCSMGNPASPILANLVMNFVIDEILKQILFEIPFLKLYVDDTISAIPKNEINNILGFFNAFTLVILNLIRFQNLIR